MSYQRKIAVAVLVVLATGLCVAGAGRPGEPSEQSVDQRLLELEECYATLEQRLAATESRLNKLIPLVVRARGAGAPVFLDSPAAPPGATPFQFNGMTYYNMPLSATSSGR